MDAARELFVKEGYEAVSMRKIAEAIEYSPTAIYTLFEDKEDLMHALCSNDFAKFAEGLQQLAKIADPIERIRQTGHSYIRFAIANPNHYRLMFMTAHNVHATEDEIREKRGKPDQDGYAFLKFAVEEGLKQKRFRSEYTHPDLLTQVFWAGVHGIASLDIIFSKDPWLEWVTVEHTAAAMIDGLLRGLLADGEKRKKS